MIMFSLFITSCGNYFNPRYYYNRDKTSSGAITNESIPDDVGEEETVPEDEDPFKNGAWNDIGYNGFNGNEIKDWFLKVSFDDNNVPIYEFYKDDSKSWYYSDPSIAEYNFDASGDGNKAQGISITPMTVYKYEFKNPLVTADSTYNQSDRMNRFLFYRIKGAAKVAGIGVDLNNYLIAVDTHSKLVFAYAKITKTASAPVVGTPYPIEFKAVELFESKKKFYEYDPIGIVHADGKVTLYAEYQNEMRLNSTGYFPSIHDENRPIASYQGAGTSPYFNKNASNNKKEMKLTFTSIELRNIDSKSANRNAITGNVGWFGTVFDYALFGYDMKLDFYSSSSDVHSLSPFTTLNPSKIDQALKVKLDSVGSINIESKEHSLLYEENDDITISMAVNLTKYDERSGDFLYEVHYPYAYSENDKIKIELKYNKNNNTFELASITDEYGDRIKSKTSSLTVNENSEAEISMIIDGMDGPDNEDNCGNGATGLNNQIELKIKFKFEKIK